MLMHIWQSLLFSNNKISFRLPAYIYTRVLCTHVRIHSCRDLVHLDSSGPQVVLSRPLGSNPNTPCAVCVRACVQTHIHPHTLPPTSKSTKGTGNTPISQAPSVKNNPHDKQQVFSYTTSTSPPLSPNVNSWTNCACTSACWHSDTPQPVCTQLYNHRKECTYTCASRPMQWCSNFSAMGTIANFPWIFRDSFLDLMAYVVNQVLTTHLVRWLSWAFATQERKKERILGKKGKTFLVFWVFLRDMTWLAILWLAIVCHVLH